MVMAWKLVWRHTVHWERYHLGKWCGFGRVCRMWFSASGYVGHVIVMLYTNRLLLLLCTARYRQQFPEWTVLSHIDHFVQGEIVLYFRSWCIVLNFAAQLVFSSSSSNHITPLLHCLHWLKAPERIQILADELLQAADLGIRTRLRLALTTSLPVHRTQLSTVGDRAFPVAAARTWNDLPRHVTSTSSLPFFRSHLKMHLFRRFFPVTFFQCLPSDSCHYWRSYRSLYLLT